MLKGRGRDPRVATPSSPAHLSGRPSAQAHPSSRPLAQRAPLAKPEPDYEVVEFPSDQYVNAKLQPPPPPPPRPPTGHPAEAGASCGLCGGGGARVRCAECGRRALCASCDDMYHRHPKRRHHQRQALSQAQLRDERPPLPPKTTPPVPPPRRHKLSGDRSSASPRPAGLEQRRATLGHMTMPSHSPQPAPMNNHTTQHPIPPHLQGKLAPPSPAHLGSLPYLPTNVHHASATAAPPQMHPAQVHGNTISHVSPAWGRQRGSLQGFNVPPNVVNAVPVESWEAPESISPSGQTSPWGRPLRRGASVLELGGVSATAGCAGCAHCAPVPWRYGSCASLDHPWAPSWQAPPPACCLPPHPAMHNMHVHPHSHLHASQTPQPYRRAESRAVSRAGSRTGSRAASPAVSVRSRTSRRTKHRTPSPPPLPSSDADSESESDSDHRPPHKPDRGQDRRIDRREDRRNDRREERREERRQERRDGREERLEERREERRQEGISLQQQGQLESTEEGLQQETTEESLGPAPTPPSVAWQCEHCTFVNEPGVRVCAVCCRTPTTVPKIIPSGIESDMAKLAVADENSPSPVRTAIEDPHAKQNGEATKQRPVKERASTGCGPSPPREENRKSINRLVTPTREPTQDRTQQKRERHDMGVGPSPPRDQETRHSMATIPSPPRESNMSVRASPFKDIKMSPLREPPNRHSVSVGPSPPRDSTLRPSMTSSINAPRKSGGPSPPRERVIESRSSSASMRANVSNTGTSPPPQSISTQTYEVSNSWERERAPSASRSRPRRRFRDEGRRERSHSRHSLSSDTRESERSVRTSGGAGRWEWRETRDSSPGGEWSDAERRRGERLTRRASHLDLRRARPVRRASFYGSEAASPEPLASNRALSLEALAGAGARREAERGLELARLMTDAERLGFSAAEVHAALAQNPTAPLSWLRERWPSLCAGVRAAAARLAPGCIVSELEARAALARHRGAMWPAVTECVERHRRQAEVIVTVGEEGRLRGHVWGSPAGADDDAAPPARHPLRRAEDSSDEFEAPTPNKFRDDDWMYLPLDPPKETIPIQYQMEPPPDLWSKHQNEAANGRTEDIAHRLKSLLLQAGVPSIDENLLLKGLLADNTMFKTERENNYFNDNLLQDKPQPVDLVQSEIDFIDAYNALTRLSPLPIINNPVNNIQVTKENVLLHVAQETLMQPPHDYLNISRLSYKNGTNDKEKTSMEITNTQNQPRIENNAQSETLTTKKDNEPKLNIRQEIVQNKNTSNLTPPELNSITSIDTRPTNEQKISVKENTLKESITEALTVTAPPAAKKIRKTVSPRPNSSKHLSTSSETQDPPNLTQNPSFEVVDNRPDEEKTTNLSDIVDTTQRLIQQMKEEINSDINSLDGRSLSQSEADISSNDSDLSTEHESSYTESQEETDDLTSDENNDEDDNARSEKSGTVINRTSSEDNEQFEEAMDHIEEQTENFKQTNIAILDSIARSLQEHIFTIEVNQTPEMQTLQNEHNASVEPNKTRPPKLAKSKTQDVNNNLFAAVNSFEEIYDQLNPTTSSADENTTREQPKLSEIQNTTLGPQNTTQRLKVHLEKKEVEILIFRPTAPSKILFIEHHVPVYNALIEIIEEPLQITEYDSLENNASNIIENIDGYVTILDNDLENRYLETTSNSVNTQEKPKIIANDLQNTSEYKDHSENEDDISTHSDTPRNSVSPARDDNNPLSDTNYGNHNNDNESDILSVNTKNASAENMTSNQDDQIISFDPKAKSKSASKSPDKSIPSSPNDTKNSSINRSNIPKLIRVMPNSKQKVDKNTSKVIASKVPVRRGSIKQYPAPAPPKTHFGNIQSGHVKQLQTRLFNNKPAKVATAPVLAAEAKAINRQTTTTIEIKASTSSTLSKKRPAPLPPSKSQEKQSTEPSPPKEKKNNYFRETCRTEDEWTESDSEDSQLQISKGNDNDEPRRVPSPPPPLTLRRVSGQLIDLARIRLLEGSPERQARMLLAEGATESWEQAQLAVELVSRGADPPAALLAALECVDLNAALAYLHQDCELCASRYPEHEMVSMLRCTHRCCRECAHHYFTVQITERSIADCVCPYCKEPELENLPEDSWLEYFAHLDILLKTLLETDIHELFQRKLRDRTLAKDPNFRWCVECSSGFFVHPKQKKLRCPECKSVSCATCRKPWSPNHEGLSCEQYVTWLEDNDPERSVAAVQQHLRENGLECPRCHFKYSLSRGGCMHFTCTQCKYEFCYGCGKPFMMGARCGLSEYCARLGLHAHHPRNCLFYLRDKEPHELQTLLQMNNVTYETEPAEGGTGRCPIQLQRETPGGLVDGTCGSDVPPHHAGLCKNHYLEYLSRLVRARKIDPLPLLGVDDLETLVRRAAQRLPPRPYGTLEGIYKRALAEIVKEKIPLD